MRENNENSEPIGIAVFTTYTSCMGAGTYYKPPCESILCAPGFGARDFHNIYVIEDQIVDKIKVKGAWMNQEDVFLFEGATHDEEILFKREQKKKYEIVKWTIIHELYDKR